MKWLPATAHGLAGLEAWILLTFVCVAAGHQVGLVEVQDVAMRRFSSPVGGGCLLLQPASSPPASSPLHWHRQPAAQPARVPVGLRLGHQGELKRVSLGAGEGQDRSAGTCALSHRARVHVAGATSWMDQHARGKGGEGLVVLTSSRHLCHGLALLR